MMKKPDLFMSRRDRYIEEVLEAQERELEELRRKRAKESGKAITPREPGMSSSEGEPPVAEQSGPDAPVEEFFVEEHPEPDWPKEELTARETRGVIGQALLAGLLVGGIFLGAMLVFLLFCINVWFK